MNTHQGHGSTETSETRDEKAFPLIDSELMKKLVDDKIKENKTRERAKRVIRYEPTKMIWKEAITYARKSTDRQDTTFETQSFACRKKAQELGLEIVREYEDEITGKTDLADRQGMSRMMREIKPGQVLIVYSISRIARQIDVFYSIMKMLKEKGCRVICCHEKLDSLDPNMEVIWAVHAAFAQTEREAISSRTKAALQTKKRNGQAVGRPSWGTRIDPVTKKSVLIPHIQEIIKKIVEMRTIQKFTLQQIADVLNDISCPNPSNSGKWERRMVSVVLQRELGKEEAKKYRKEPALSFKRKEEEKRLLEEDLEFLTSQRELDTPPEFVPNSIPDSEKDLGTISEMNSLSPQVQIPVQETTDQEPQEPQETIEQEPQEPQETIEQEPQEPQETIEQEPRTGLEKKSPVVLKALLMKRKEEFGLSEEEIRAMGKEDMIEILSLC